MLLSFVDNSILKDSIEVNPRVTVREIAENLGIHYSIGVPIFKCYGKIEKVEKFLTNWKREIRWAVLCFPDVREIEFFTELWRVMKSGSFMTNRRRSGQWRRCVTKTHAETRSSFKKDYDGQARELCFICSQNKARLLINIAW